MNALVKSKFAWFVALLGAGLGTIAIYAALANQEASSADPRDPEIAIAALAGRASVEQQPALADRQVTREEYVAAVEATLACVRDKGVIAKDPRWVGNDTKYIFVFGGYETREELNQASAHYNACYLVHLRETDLAWEVMQAKNRPPLPTIDEMARCFESKGIRFAEKPDHVFDLLKATDSSPQLRHLCMGGEAVMVPDDW